MRRLWVGLQIVAIAAVAGSPAMTRAEDVDHVTALVGTWACESEAHSTAIDRFVRNADGSIVYDPVSKRCARTLSAGHRGRIRRCLSLRRATRHVALDVDEPANATLNAAAGNVTVSGAAVPYRGVTGTNDAGGPLYGALPTDAQYVEPFGARFILTV